MDPNTLTQLLERSSRGDRQAMDRLMRGIQAELRRIARLRPGVGFRFRSFGTTEIVQETYVKLFGKERVWNDSKHFFNCAVTTIRNLLIDHARTNGRAKRQAGGERVDMEVAEQEASSGRSSGRDDLDVLVVDEALQRLGQEHPMDAEVLRLTHYAGLSAREVAEVLGVSRRQIERRLRFGRAWLRRALS